MIPTNCVKAQKASFHYNKTQCVIYEHHRVSGDNDVGKEDRVVADVRATKIQQPSNFIQRSYNKTNSFLLTHFLPHLTNFLWPFFSCVKCKTSQRYLTIFLNVKRLCFIWYIKYAKIYHRS